MKIGILSGILFCFSIAVKSQNSPIKNLLDSAESVWYMDFAKTDEFVRKAEAIVAVRGAANNVADLIGLYNLRIQSCNAFSRFQLWRQYIQELQQFLDQNRKALGLKEYQLFSLINNWSEAQYLEMIGDNARALEIFVRLLSDFKRLPQSAEVCDRLQVISNDIADIHQRNGEYEAAVNQFLAGIHYQECGSGSTDFSLVYRNIGLAYFEKRDYENAGKYLRLAEKSLQPFLKNSPVQAARVALSLYECESSYYERIGRHDSASLPMQKAIPLLKLNNVGDSFKGRINLSLGNLYLRENKFTTAEAYFGQAERFFLNAPEDQPVHLSTVYLAQADLLERLGKTVEALKLCGKAFERLVLDFRPDADGNPYLSGLRSKKQVFKVLQKKSQLLEKLFRDKNETKILIRAVNTNKLALALLDSTANEISLDKDKVILSEESYSAFEIGIRMTNALYQRTRDPAYLDDCFMLVDKSKGILLLENLRVVNRFAGINPEWMNREKEIKSELLLTEQTLYTLETENGNAGELAGSRERYANLKRDYASLMDKIKTEAPDYYRLRFNHAVISASEVQSQSLRNGEAMIEFFVGDSTLAVIGLTADKRHVAVKKIHGDFFEKITRLRSLLTKPGDKSDDVWVTKTSSDLYAFLIQDAIRELGAGITSITIIPDGILGYLPFEVLRNPAWQHKYLGEECAVHYAYSATYLTEQLQKKASVAKYFFAGFASSSAADLNHQQLSALPYAEKEITSITDLLGGSYSIFNPASKEDFKNHASDFRILHLAMHSLVNDENPMFSVLVFAPAAGDSSNNHVLTALELYDMTLHSDMAVLSACNTGFGTLRKGEGIMSFARAFSYAGVPSAVISLWQVPDKATSKIMVNFYKYLKQGESKDGALQRAKLDFIRDYPQMSAPFFWAGFILTGSKEPLRFPGSWLWYWIAAGILIALSDLIVARRFKTDIRLSQSHS